MKWVKDIFKTKPKACMPDLKTINKKFTGFLKLLDKNNQILKIISDMEEKKQGEYLFDSNYIYTSIEQIRAGVGEIIDNMIILGGSTYNCLRERYAALDAELACLCGKRPIEKDNFIIPFENLGKDRAFSTGSKNAQLGEMKKLGLPVPDGFAIIAWAYKYFMDSNNLQERISEYINSLDINRYEDLVSVSNNIQTMVISANVPDDLSGAIQNAYTNLKNRVSFDRFSLRSSAIGEDTLYSFAGQYASFLNVTETELIACYRKVIASKFTPQAIYYFLSHSLLESELAMSVGCVAMIDAIASGVVYTQNPVNPDDGCLLINSIYGLGKYLVDGTLTPDVFQVSRKDKSIKQSNLSSKQVRLVTNPDGGTVKEDVSLTEQELPSINQEQIQLLADYAMKLEKHYGSPQDIEWAVDKQGGLFLLQTRPLRIIKSKTAVSMPDVSNFEVITSDGTTVCPGAGIGKIYHAGSSQELSSTPDSAVLVASHPFPGLITVMRKIKALVTEVGSAASHTATIAREYQLPTLAGVKNINDLPEGKLVTVDATNGVIYAGAHQELVSACAPDSGLFEDMVIFNLLDRVLSKISPLNLVHPADANFTQENCQTFHDITRFAHQKAMEEMFAHSKTLGSKEGIGIRLKTDIPLPVYIIYLDKDCSDKCIKEDNIASIPMKVFWNGIKKQGWPAQRPVNFKGFMSVVASNMTSGDPCEFTQNSFAILSKEYMMLSLHLGYHFTTIEAMCTSEPSKNYIRMQYKNGGASIERRVRRIKLITDILSKAGFEHTSKGDFLDTVLSYNSFEGIKEKLYILGRLTMMTKQLDMALTNEAVAQWYTEDFIKKLGL